MLHCIAIVAKGNKHCPPRQPSPSTHGLPGPFSTTRCQAVYPENEEIGRYHLNSLYQVTPREWDVKVDVHLILICALINYHVQNINGFTQLLWSGCSTTAIEKEHCNTLLAFGTNGESNCS